MMYAHITDFFQRIGIDQELYLPQIIKMIARIDPSKFFQLDQTDDTFYALFYLFQNMLEFSFEGLKYFDRELFIETYHLSDAQLTYNLEKIMKADLGFYRISWESDLFFQQDDLIGGVVFNLIRNAIEAEIVKRSLKIPTESSIESIANEIGEKMIQLQLIRVVIKKAFIRFIEVLTIKFAIDRGFTRVDIAEYWPDLNKLLLDKEGIDITKEIFGVSTNFERIQAIEDAFRFLSHQ